MTEIGKVLTAAGFVALIMVVSILLGKPRQEPRPDVRVEYRLYDKKRPATWLRKYAVPTTYYVWDDERGRYVEASKERFDATPDEEAK